VVHTGELGTGHEVRDVVVRVAAQEHEEAADGVRPAEAEQVLVEVLHRSERRGVGGHVAELRGAQRRVGRDGALLAVTAWRRIRPACPSTSPPAVSSERLGDPGAVKGRPADKRWMRSPDT
jgi:hypothetical protein